MPKIVALLSWYDERPSALSATVKSIAPLCDALVAADGAYAAFPAARPGPSADEQATAIRDSARAHDLSLMLYEPQGVWETNEVGKRDWLFRAAETITGPDDWYFIIDGDEVLERYPPDMANRLDVIVERYDAARVTVYEKTPLLESHYMRFFRAIRGLRCLGRHYCFMTPDGRQLSGDDPLPCFEDSRDYVRIRHDRAKRTRKRGEAADGWHDMLRCGFEHRT